MREWHHSQTILPREVKWENTSKAVTPLLPFLLVARLLFNFSNMVSYSMNCMEGLLTWDQQQPISKTPVVRKRFTSNVPWSMLVIHLSRNPKLQLHHRLLESANMNQIIIIMIIIIIQTKGSSTSKFAILVGPKFLQNLKHHLGSPGHKKGL